MAKLDSFTRAYIEAALWSTNDESDESGGEPLDKNYSASDIDPETMKSIIEDCADFQKRYAELLAESGLDDGKAGHYFWLSRNGHGSGFFDEDLDALQDAAEAYGVVNLQVDDGVISDGVHWTRTTSEARMVRQDARDHRTVYLDADRSLLDMMHGWSGGQNDPLYAIASRNGENEAWVFQDAIANLDADIAKVKKLGKDKFQFGKGTFTKKEIDELSIIRDALVWALEMGMEERDPKTGRFVPPPPQVVADFSSIQALIEHEFQQNGATHMIFKKAIYYPLPDGDYEEGVVWQERGYWHATAPEARSITKLPSHAETIEAYLARSGTGQVTESRSHSVRDYVAVDSRGRHVAGPFKDYGTAKQKADRAGGYVQFAVEEAARRKRIPSSRGRRVPMTADAVMQLASDLAKKTNGGTPKHIGSYRWSGRNESAQFTTYSPEYSQKVVVVVSIFEDGSTAANFFSDEGLSGTDTYESVGHFDYNGADIPEMVKDIHWVWKTVDGYAESWGAGQDEVEETQRTVPSGAAYYTVVIPYVAKGRTQWHPTSPSFAPLTRGAFGTREEAEAWARSHLGPGAEFTIRHVPAVSVSEARRPSRPSRAEMIAALGLDPEGHSRQQKYAATTDGFWKKIRTHQSEAAHQARQTLGLPEPAVSEALPDVPRALHRAVRRIRRALPQFSASRRRRRAR